MRRKQAVQRAVKPDLKLGSTEVTKTINLIMIGGNKATAEKIFYEALTKAATKEKVGELELFQKIINTLKPEKITSTRRVGASTYNVPKTISEKQKLSKAIKFLINAARKLAWNEGKKISNALAIIMEQTFHGTGPAMQELKTLSNIVNDNEAFSYLRF